MSLAGCALAQLEKSYKALFGKKKKKRGCLVASLKRAFKPLKAPWYSFRKNLKFGDFSKKLYDLLFMRYKSKTLKHYSL